MAHRHGDLVPPPHRARPSTACSPGRTYSGVLLTNCRAREMAHKKEGCESILQRYSGQRGFFFPPCET